MGSAAEGDNNGGGRPRSSVLKSFIHRRNQSEGSALFTSPPSVQVTTTPAQHISAAYAQLEGRMPPPPPIRTEGLGALGELNNHSSPRKQQPVADSNRDRSRSPTKSAFSNMSFKSLAKEARKSRDVSPEKPKKTKSSTNLAGFLSRPRSTMSLNKTTKEEEERRQAKDKENRTPPSSTSSADMTGGPAPPIYAQFCSQDLGSNGLRGKASFDAGSGRYGSDASSDLSKKQRPKSYHPSTAISEHKSTSDLRSRPKMDGREPSASERIKSKVQRPKLFTAFSAAGSSTKSKASDSADRPIDPKAIDQHLEAMLDRRNIPENQRYKMRSLADTIKMEFIRQDWAEMAAKEQAGVADTTAEPTSAATGGSDKEETQSKRSRGRSFTLSRKKDPKEPASPTKKSKGENTSIGRHFRSKSTESVVSERPVSASSTGSNGILSKIKFGQGPGDYVSYLRKVQKPELVEVGKLHKLRLLLRNETVSWTEDFIKQGGMEEIVGLLKRILAIEWREEHDDALLHENLLCLKALCTTALALQYLHSIHEDLFPKLLHMLFDPEKKGPSEFTTRNIITSVLFTYIESATPMERIARAQKVLSFLRNPQPKEEERPLGFVLEMRKDRPYTVWNKEVVSVTKEVFWIFLHHLNVIALPSEMSTKGGAPLGTITNGASSFQDPHAFMHRHFPSERPPVPAAPYVGGVEWDATNYLASHLDLMNAIIACTPTAAQRNNLRNDLRISGWEKVLGGSLRLCKEKFYGCVHEALRCWVAAATEDGWDSRDVRYGPPPESRSASPKKTQKAQKPVDAAPKIEIPKLDFGLDNHRVTPVKERDVWLS
ncbi:GTPase binding protein Rid1 [Colletotrichum paranaense]|uniref:GTPase binding protein Rid1 n=4 Tax=Colletotrichum acutatum species complex TaxID=2707335 RepID=A0AAI9YR54_9PEZI|nr:GTPase binding protein Rid1 [Colletotrichum costaricense]XP_060344310.1 GTPase binding protein Rid1 [Colletotrichum paranaense]XP_060382012.1 GTPase binding protein Rid1 [Colletotrichum tamarilloi]KAI3545788.1 GTPase binding protein Rid1 [Colletotrichum filicis]KAK1463279.1 GTPase binding protein Rid1 [Colletotrichum melonis]KAK1498522.1 GTPase binding protein Rid1 [Colletotrichum tamarilloi]KAK1520465.1 GTPase binding protein Rid1 [Colletotrichum costaricense]KAK1527963.1 GTPase binding 